MGRVRSFLRWMAVSATALALGLVITDPGAAQSVSGVPDPPQAERPRTTFVGLGTGLGLGTMRVGNDGESATGLLLTGQFAVGRGAARTWVMEVTGQAFKIPNPVREEEYRAVSFMVRRAFGSGPFVAPGLGIDYRKWSGPDPWEPSDLGLTLGLNLGLVIPVSERLHALPELSLQVSHIETEGSVSGRLVSLRVTLLRASR